PLTAQMTFLGLSYEGCARQGRPAITEVAGFYWYQPQGGHQVMFKLSKDYKVQLVSRDSFGKAVTEHGQWQYLQSGKLIFSMRDAEKHEYLMLFRRASNGQLVLQTGSDRLAALGATFQLWQPSDLPGGQRLPAENANPTDKPPLIKASAFVEAPTQQPSSLLPSAQPPSLLTDTLLEDAPVQAADIDDELLNEIIVDDNDHH
ncbi:hypothetical protein, partial [Amphritea atlantica]